MKLFAAFLAVIIFAIGSHCRDQPMTRKHHAILIPHNEPSEADRDYLRRYRKSLFDLAPPPYYYDKNCEYPYCDDKTPIGYIPSSKGYYDQVVQEVPCSSSYGDIYGPALPPIAAVRDPQIYDGDRVKPVIIEIQQKCDKCSV